MLNKGGDAPIYPCQFPIKVIGENNEGLKAVIARVMASLDEAVNPDEMKTTFSKNKKYLSVTFTIVAKSTEHIERVYSALNARKEVKMVL